jgi:hypothetical protein
MKKINLVTITGGLLTAMFCLGCGETTEEKAAKASQEFCDCLKKNSMSKCEDELNKKYESYAINETFIKEFNAVKNCGVYIYKKPKKSLKTFKVKEENNK